MKKVLFICCLAAVALSSCGLVEFDNDENVTRAQEMKLERDVYYVMVGDSFKVAPVFTPDDAISNREVFWYVENEEFIRVVNDSVIGVAEGESTIYGIAVQDLIEASAKVIVMPSWKEFVYDYPYETIVYAEVSIDGQPLTDRMKVAAFVDEDCRGVGQLREWQGQQYWQFRIGSEMTADDDDDYVSPKEEISFVLYDSKTARRIVCPETFYFDGETHGTLSNLYHIDFTTTPTTEEE